MHMNIGNLKRDANAVYMGRITTLTIAATIALREVRSHNEKAPAYDVMALAADRRSWVKVGAVWEFTSNETGEAFLSGKIDDPSLERPLDLAMFGQEDGSFNVVWRRPQRKRAALPPLEPAVDEDTSSPSSGQSDDGLGESTAPAQGEAKTATTTAAS
jgi:uncharacterized protein (DUF736 family)